MENHEIIAGAALHRRHRLPAVRSILARCIAGARRDGDPDSARAIRAIVRDIRAQDRRTPAHDQQGRPRRPLDSRRSTWNADRATMRP